MAKFEVIEDEGTRFVRATLDNETIRAERGAFCYMFGNIKVHASLPSASWYVKSTLSEESLVRPTYTGSGVIYLESSLGGFHSIALDDESWILEGGTYWASDGGVDLHVFRERMVTSVWAGDGLFDFQTRVSGKGAVVMTCAGPVEKVRLDNEQLLADGRFVIARTEGISYKMRRVAKSWFRSKLAGERLARFYEGTGSILVCSYPYWRLRLSKQGVLSDLR